MWHPVKYVAASRGLPPADLEGFAIANHNKYGIVVEYGYAEVNTWHVDALVNDFRKQQHNKR